MHSWEKAVVLIVVSICLTIIICTAINRLAEENMAFDSGYAAGLKVGASHEDRIANSMTTNVMDLFKEHRAWIRDRDIATEELRVWRKVQ